ncbi:MBL fold metallo-hydrolase [Desulfomonile tiedjei]|uniref:Zn-dependent hydrolase, glyoxylase n=1 Tax=Desulfomonile tiedjei (strain ATCC 49306 / DSM 6799 / DCB-1) TaxID=706587 RepID=I4C3C0_DESTA|nr:MBL fold metallo-hydrolase [Desulfomonile tiedjei]AFM24061.1 Zn-dependent hydrolase, glyoxylase [Desulfomonile tiedjei DSM 6799]
MKFKVFKCVAVLYLAVCSSVLAGEQPGLQRISDHVYGYVDIKNASPAGNSFGANTGLIVGRDAALVVDTLVSAKEADRFLADIRKVTDKPVKYVVNTHYHLDHAWGNCQFVKLGAVVIAHANTRPHIAEAAKTLANPEVFGLTTKDLEGTTVQAPTITFTDSMTVDLGDVTVELRYPGPTHTNDSITVYVPKDNVIFLGDILFSRYHPFLGEGDLDNWQKVLVELQGTPAAKIVPGHGPVAGKSDLEAMKTYMREFDTLARSLCSGKSAQDAPAIAQEIIRRLPDQQRSELPKLVEFNLRAKYLPQPEAKK